MEKKGLKVNAGKTKVRLAQVEDSGEHPWGVPGRELVTTQSYALCLRWVHKRCSGISGKLKSNVDFHSRRCLERNHVQSVFTQRSCVKLECVPKVLLFG